ncbi:hypothetical protein SEA_ANNASERENA_2 [Microbacterium phage AnnaSerena]|uniref:Uncharacterized protein n=1 Tax=Microbacterium phage AnnaSerena TaxID=2201432 RepID=A0A2Z4Q4K3_9CAUD|nr:hypothetical protein SEA_ANNASERENA_2 [Microbacterium phage AnnaSerena]
MANKKDRYADLPEGGRSEYGGGEVPQRYPDGSSRPLQDIPASVGERARLLRQAGMNDYSADPMTDLPAAALTGIEYAKMSAAQKEAYDLDMVLYRERQARRADLQERTNGYIDETAQFEGERVDGSLGSDQGIKSSIERDASGSAGGA